MVLVVVLHVKFKEDRQLRLPCAHFTIWSRSNRGTALVLCYWYASILHKIIKYHESTLCILLSHLPLLISTVATTSIYHNPHDHPTYGRYGYLCLTYNTVVLFLCICITSITNRDLRKARSPISAKIHERKRKSVALTVETSRPHAPHAKETAFVWAMSNHHQQYGVIILRIYRSDYSSVRRM